MQEKSYLSLGRSVPWHLTPGPWVQWLFNCSKAECRTWQGNVQRMLFKKKLGKDFAVGCFWPKSVDIGDIVFTDNKKAKSLITCELSFGIYVGVLLIFIWLEKGRNYVCMFFRSQYYMAEKTNTVLPWSQGRVMLWHWARPSPAKITWLGHQRQGLQHIGKQGLAQSRDGDVTRTMWLQASWPWFIVPTASALLLVSITLVFFWIFG